MSKAGECGAIIPGGNDKNVTIHLKRMQRSVDVILRPSHSYDDALLDYIKEHA